ncbi:hypothetical protein J3L18_23245 [Mucilaginibacter gossypii]|uniref:hypothetical protein n=1 Tax=Mucilaginibacter gossypii TaxID=551996 RepID=UPI000DCBE753|nr:MULTISPECIES: hypothetical protein [Mucilaginibacter]QTE36031.1 hypothetical protein J3L18_23245 [Mucilaginibacter gossypii]RAV56705.1 hypothetical protein DIU36_14990 [Mucilaginibacter rubeus]
MMQYSLNGHDLKQTYGVLISNGSETFLAFPKRKDSLEMNWPEQDGIDKDLNDPHFEAREFKLTCALIAYGLADFNNKYNGFFTELSKLGTHELYIKDLDRTFLVYYKDQQNLTKLSQIDRDKCGVKFDLIFGETNPADNIPKVYLVDDEDNFLIA